MSKTPFEVRLELLTLAQKTLQSNYLSSNERFLSQFGGNGQAKMYDYGLTAAPKIPTIVEIIEYAVLLNNFVTDGRDKPVAKSDKKELTSEERTKKTVSEASHKLSPEAELMKSVLETVQHAETAADSSEKVMEDENKFLNPDKIPEFIMEIDLAARRFYPETDIEKAEIGAELKILGWPDNERTRAFLLKKLRTTPRTVE